jgi:hypothetical protein
MSIEKRKPPVPPQPIDELPPPHRVGGRAMTPAEWNRLARQDPDYRRRGLEWQRDYYRRNRNAIRYAAKCRAAGVPMTLAQARAALRDDPSHESASVRNIERGVPQPSGRPRSRKE